MHLSRPCSAPQSYRDLTASGCFSGKPDAARHHPPNDVSLIDSDNQKYDTGKYIGDSYRDLTRIANINEDLWTELFFTNKNNLLKSIQGCEDQLDILKKAIKEEDADTLKAMFIESSKRRKNLEK